MPNHVTTRCTVTGPVDDIARFCTRCIVAKADKRGGQYTAFDFETLIPMPAVCSIVEEIGGTADVLAVLAGSSRSHVVWEDLRRFDRGGHMGPWKGTAFFERGEIERRLEAAMPGCVENARKMARCIGETGFKSWYDWSIANWGTKWNSYAFVQTAEEPLQFLFQTAWSFPLPVFEKLATEFPSLQFYCQTFDEGWNFAGEGYFNSTPAFRVDKDLATDELYARVYGHPPERDDDEAA